MALVHCPDVASLDSLACLEAGWPAVAESPLEKSAYGVTPADPASSSSSVRKRSILE